MKTITFKSIKCKIFNKLLIDSCYKVFFLKQLNKTKRLRAFLIYPQQTMLL